MGIGPAATIVKLDHVFQCLQAAIVHVRTGQDHAAQRGRFEPAAVGIALRNGKASQVERLLAPAYARVVELLIGEIGAAMAAPAAGFAFVEPQTMSLLRCQGRDIALAAEAIDGAIAAQQDALEAGQGFTQIGRRHTPLVRLLEASFVLLVLLQAFYCFGDFGAQFRRMFNGAQGLGFQRHLPAVPEER